MFGLNKSWFVSINNHVDVFVCEVYLTFDSNVMISPNY